MSIDNEESDDEDGFIVYDDEPDPTSMTREEYLDAWEKYKNKIGKASVFIKMTNQFRTYLNEGKGTFAQRGLRKDTPVKIIEVYNEYLKLKNQGYWKPETN